MEYAAKSSGDEFRGPVSHDLFVHIPLNQLMLEPWVILLQILSLEPEYNPHHVFIVICLFEAKFLTQ